MTTVVVATAKVRPHPMLQEESDLTAWVCVTHCKHDGGTWAFIGASETHDGARQDLVSQLSKHGVEAPIHVNECLDTKVRRHLIWSAKSRAIQNGAPIAVVHE